MKPLEFRENDEVTMATSKKLFSYSTEEFNFVG
jgi:hypothetical protein